MAGSAQGGGAAQARRFRWPRSDGRTARVARAAALSLAIAALLSLLLLALRDRLSTANVALLYLLPVLAGAMLGGLLPGVVAAVACAFAFDLLFIPPYGTLTVASGQDVLTLSLYLAVGALAAELTERARARAEEASRRASANALLYDLSTALLAGDLPQILQALVERIARAFGLSSCGILLPDDRGNLAVQAVAGDRVLLEREENERRAAAVAEWAYRQGDMVALSLDRSTRFRDRVRRRAGEGPATMAGDALLYLPLQSGTAGALRAIGLLQLVRPAERPLTDEEIRLLGAFATQAALAVERAQLSAVETEAAVLRESDRAKSALLSNVSHDLRTPLTTIRGAADSLLQEDVTLDAATRAELLRSVRDEADRLSRLVANLMDLSRLEAGVLSPDRHLYDLGEIVGGVVARLGVRLARHRLRLCLDSEVRPIPVDYALMDQVVENLLDNAAKYAQVGSEITVTLEEVGDEVELRVADEGPGIAAKARGRVFERFYRHPRAERSGALGSGLGLAICRAAVGAHGGRIWITEDRAVGTEVCIRLPRVSQADVVPKAAAAQV